LSKLEGTATLEMGAGRIVDIGEAAGAKMDIGRTLSMFSLQTIPRRLSLAFSDLFQKGYSYDSLKGKFKFTGGNIYTTNAPLEGPVGGVGVSGRLGVAAEDVELALCGTAAVASSSPVAAARMGGAGVGRAARAASTAVSAAVSSPTAYQYSGTESWDNPVWGTG